MDRQASTLSRAFSLPHTPGPGNDRKMTHRAAHNRVFCHCGESATRALSLELGGKLVELHLCKKHIVVLRAMLPQILKRDPPDIRLPRAS